MKRNLSLLALVLFSIPVLAQNVLQTSNTNENQPYKIWFNNLKFGNATHSKIVLNAWKAYDNNMLDEIAMVLADTVVAGMPDGTMIRGKENFLNAMKTYRSGFTSVVSSVDACTTLKSPAMPDDEVTVIWGSETDTKKDGTIQRVQLHEIWFFNKAGKVSQFYQYATPVLEK